MAKKMYAVVDQKIRKIRKGYCIADQTVKKIHKGYTVIGGKIRPFWSGGELEYFGNSEDGAVGALSNARTSLAAASTDKHAMFAGGARILMIPSAPGTGNSPYPVYYVEPYYVDAYTPKLTKVGAGALSQGRYNLCAATAGDKMLFAGGTAGTSGNTNVIDVYNNNLTRMAFTDTLAYPLNIATASFGDYAFFYGGYQSSDYYTNQVIIINKDLTTQRQALNRDIAFVGGTATETHAIFAGGAGYYKYSDGTIDRSRLPDVTIYNRELVRSTSSLPVGVAYIKGVKAGTNAIFAGGTITTGTYYQYTTTDAAYAFDQNATMQEVDPLSKKANLFATTNLQKYGLLFGGWPMMEAYDDKLTHLIPQKQPQLAHSDGAACASIGSFALLAGGSEYTAAYANVDVYEAGDG